MVEHVMRGDAVERRRKVAAVDLLGLENDSKTEELAAAAAASICDGQQLRQDSTTKLPPAIVAVVGSLLSVPPYGLPRSL